MTANALAKLSSRKREVECNLEGLGVDVKKIARKIEIVEDEIAQVASKLNWIDTELRTPGLSTDVQAQLRTQMQQLWTEKEQLRTKEKQLRIKEKQLMTKEAQLREQLLGVMKQMETLEAETVTSSKAYLDRVVLMDPPSKTNMKREQLDPGGPLIRNWRPTQEQCSGLLPELAHPTFGEVVDELDSFKELDEASMNVSGQMCYICADFYKNEAELAKGVRGLLQPYLEDGMVATIKSGFASSNVSPDWALGDSPMNPTNLFLIAAVKPGIGGTGDSHFQGANYHLHFWRERTKSSIFQSTRCPAFLLEVVGPHVRLSAVAWLDRVTIFPLTPLLNLLPAHPVTDRLLMPVARMLAALRAGLRKLAQEHATTAGRTAAEHEAARAGPPAKAEDVETEDVETEGAETEDAETAQQLAGVLEAVPVRLKKLPWPIAMDARYQAETARLLAAHNYTYRVGLVDDDRGRDRVVAVKLGRSYSLAAHQRWADLDLAPKILRSMQLPGGWLLVEMEWLPAPEWRPLSQLWGEELEEAQFAVQEALERAHAATGMVHGDVRPPNCLVRRGRASQSWEVRFVDFEWAGPEGEATYPACLNPDIPWPEGVGYRKQLQREHDIKLLAATLAARRGSTAAASPARTVGRGHWTQGLGAVRSRNTASSSERSTAPPGIAVVAVARHHRIAGLSWQQRGPISWTRPAAPGRRLVW